MSESILVSSPSEPTTDLNQLLQRIAALESELEGSIADRSKFWAQWEAWIGLMSHDLRGPLTLILGYADGLVHRYQGSGEDERLIHDLRSVMAGARRMNKMVGQVVDGARLEAGRLLLQLQPVDLGALVKDEAQRHRRFHPEPRLLLTVGRRLPLVQGDSRRIAQVVASLLSNAAMFSSPVDPIRVSIRRVEGWIVISVKDQGVGLTDEERGRLFEKRFRPDRLREVRREGLGLSLWVAGEIASLHGGWLRAESQGIDQGSTFQLALPVGPDKSDSNDLPNMPRRAL